MVILLCGVNRAFCCYHHGTRWLLPCDACCRRDIITLCNRACRGVFGRPLKAHRSTARRPRYAFDERRRFREPSGSCDTSCRTSSPVFTNFLLASGRTRRPCERYVADRTGRRSRAVVVGE